MKKAIFVVVVIAALLFEYYMGPPICFYLDGGKKTMAVKHCETIIPYKTCYNVVYNRISINGEVRDTWIEFLFWNGYGIKNIEVYAVDSGMKIYPAGEEPTYLAQGEGFVAKIQMKQTNTMKDRYFIVKVRLPEKETRLQVLITDKYGNITEDVVPISSIKKL